MANNNIEPKSVEHKEPERTFEVQSNGDVVMTEQQISIVTFSTQQFRSFVEAHKENKSNYEYYLSEEGQQEMREQKEKQDKIIEVMEPHKDEAERLAREYYDLQMRETKKNEIKKDIEKYKNNEIDFSDEDTISRTKNIKSVYDNELNTEQKNQFSKEEVKKIEEIAEKSQS